MKWFRRWFERRVWDAMYGMPHSTVFDGKPGCWCGADHTKDERLAGDTTGTYLDDPGMRAAHVRSVHRG